MATSTAAEIDSLNSSIQSLINKTEGDDAARKQLFEVTFGAAMRVENPLDTCWRIIMFVKDA